MNPSLCDSKAHAFKKYTLVQKSKPVLPMVFLSNLSVNVIHRFGKEIDQSFTSSWHFIIWQYLRIFWMIGQKGHVPSEHRTINTLVPSTWEHSLPISVKKCIFFLLEWQQKCLSDTNTCILPTQTWGLKVSRRTNSSWIHQVNIFVSILK